MTQEEALEILKSGASVFLTGEPGSGKSYVASRYVSYLRRESVPASMTASTGIAAAQLGGSEVKGAARIEQDTKTFTQRKVGQHGILR